MELNEASDAVLPLVHGHLLDHQVANVLLQILTTSVLNDYVVHDYANIYDVPKHLQFANLSSLTISPS
jgi:hypothetical protein